MDITPDGSVILVPASIYLSDDDILAGDKSNTKPVV